ncbi:unnamed protein product, partial [Brassica napus]
RARSDAHAPPPDCRPSVGLGPKGTCRWLSPLGKRRSTAFEL